MKLRLFALVAVLAVMAAVPAYALDLRAARAGGQVGEKPDGYVAVIKPSPEVQALVGEVNAKRRQEYERISKENGQPVSVVSKLAAEKIINRLAPGSYYQGPDGKWVTR